MSQILYQICFEPLNDIKEVTNEKIFVSGRFGINVIGFCFR